MEALRKEGITRVCLNVMETNLCLKYESGLGVRKGSRTIQEKDMAELVSMMNIGKEMAGKLDSVGIGSAEELVCSGAEQAFLKLKERYPNVCLVHFETGRGFRGWLRVPGS